MDGAQMEQNGLVERLIDARDLLRARQLLVGRPVGRLERVAYAILGRVSAIERRRRTLARQLLAVQNEALTLPALHSSPVGDQRSVQARGAEGLSRFTADFPANHPDVTISVVTYDSARWVEAWFRSLLASDYPLDRLHLVFRDHSTERTTFEALSAELQRHGKRFGSARLFSGPNVGFGAGHDSVIRSSSSVYVLVANIDIEFHSTALLTLVQAAVGAENRIACWEARQIPFEHPKYYDPYTGETWWNAHACVLLDRSKYLKANGYDHNIFMYGEDVDLSLRLRLSGYKLSYLPTAVITHHTFTEDNRVKPLQVQGSMLASTRIKLKYATFLAVVGHAVQLRALARASDPVVAAGSRASWRLITRQGWQWPILRLCSQRIPFDGFDFEMVRAGAFYGNAGSLISAPAVERPLVSIIVRTYGARADLARGAVASILRQTYRPLQILLCEDGGGSIGRAIGGEVSCPPGVSFVALECPRGGRSKTANAGLRAASGEFVGFLDDDDALFADHVETLVEAILGQERVHAAYAKAFEVETKRDGEKTFDAIFRTPSYFEERFSLERLHQINLFPIQAVIFRRSLLELTGLVNESIDALEDWNLWCRIAEFTDFLAVNKTTSLYRVPGEPAERARRLQGLDAAYEEVRRANTAFRARGLGGRSHEFSREVA